ncbi:MAG: DUF5004 domain-containing protein [Bacteroidia bacterium]
MKKLLLLIVGATVLFAFSGCAKDNDPAPTPKKTNEEILVSGSWKLTALTISPAIDWNSDGNLITDIYSQMDACDKDDFDTYHTNKTFTSDEGSTKCDPNNPQTTMGLWSMNADQTLLYLDSEPVTIKSMSESQMVFESTYEDSGTTYTFLIKFAKK